jgi:hypothetical protein
MFGHARGCYVAGRAEPCFGLGCTGHVQIALEAELLN